MEMVSVPLSSLQSSIEYFEKELADYQKIGWTEMEKWAEGRISAYKSLLVWYTN